MAWLVAVLLACCIARLTSVVLEKAALAKSRNPSMPPLTAKHCCVQFMNDAFCDCTSSSRTCQHKHACIICSVDQQHANARLPCCFKKGILQRG